jgi:formyltetrahydrofolate deformylase
MQLENTVRLLISCPDRPGIVSAVSTFVYNHGGNILALDQHSTDPEGGRLFMRVEFTVAALSETLPVLRRSFADSVARTYGMEWILNPASEKKRVAILVSKYDHVLLDLLWKHSRGMLPAHIEMVISNHPNLQKETENFGVSYHTVAVTPETKQAAEEKLLALMAGKIDLVVLARYMQVLSNNFVRHYPSKIINIHHSFLPAFVGANPYRQAYERGVKLIGATAHYATSDLDEGPIIEQDVVRVAHDYSPKQLQALGQDIERAVLSRAVLWHLEDRVLVHGNKTIVFT